MSVSPSQTAPERRPRRKMTDAFSLPSHSSDAMRAPQQQLDEFSTYAEAERLVDQLSDKGFAVEHARITGKGLRSVEYVTGRLTIGRAALAGAAGGAWFGLLVGLLVAMFTTGAAWFGLSLASLSLGALWGGTFGLLAQRATRGRRDFASVKSIEAERYAVSVALTHADDARQLLGRM